MDNLAELINKMSISEGSNKVGSKSHIKEAKKRTGDLIESNFLVEKNADQKSEGDRRTRIPTEKDLQYPGLI